LHAPRSDPRRTLLSRVCCYNRSETPAQGGRASRASST
jgi:hypothetical protein